MKEIQLSKGYLSQVDDSDYERCMVGPKWFAKVTSNTVYAQRHFRGVDGTRKTQKLHRFILGITDPAVRIDHRSGNGLDNQRRNLRVSTPAQNSHNSRLNAGNTSGYKGVTWDATRNKWQARLGVSGQRSTVGRFTDPEDAARAYDAAALKYHGPFAKTNAMLGLLPSLESSAALAQAA